MAMLEEIKSLQGTLKETDLFKVYQTGDLANADANDTRLKHLLCLREELNSAPFRALVEKITGCEPLGTTVDLAANVYTKGCHLLCHDDVIGTRVVSYVLYLSDPSCEPWSATEDGGHLLLFDAKDGLPLAEPCKAVPPSFNTLALFVVEPGRSFHAVQEVFSQDKNRVSLQGWFHAASPGQQGKRLRKGATLEMIVDPSLLLEEDRAPAISVSSCLSSSSSSTTLTKADVAELSMWMNPLYLSSLDQIRAKCAEEENCVSLLRFLQPSLEKEVVEALRACESSSPPEPLVWRTVGPAHLRCHQELVLSESSSSSSIFATLVSRLSSPAFIRFLALALGDVTPVSHCGGRVRRFRKGKDYTVAHYSPKNSLVVDVTLCMVLPGHHDEWASGDVGGTEVYLDKEEEVGQGDVAAVYAQGEESEGVVSIDPAPCTLALVLRDESRMHFVKYVSSSAPCDRYDVTFTYVVQEEGEEED
jgi:Rps23 Pro-64 3,4-dihydroxylase Tpa1-like proline 4-hydroxylase